MATRMVKKLKWPVGAGTTLYTTREYSTSQESVRMVQGKVKIP